MLYDVLSITRSLMKQIARVDVRSKNIEQAVSSLQNRNFEAHESILSKSMIKGLGLPVENLEGMIKLNEQLLNDDFNQKLVCKKL